MKLRSDVSFVIDGQRLPAFKTLLAVKSHVFRAQFWGDFADSGLKEIEVKDATVDGFKAMLRFLYTEELFLSDEQSVEIWLDLYNLSHKYQLKRLMKCMENHIEAKLINKDNFADIHFFAFERKFDTLMEISKNFISNNINEWVEEDVNFDQLKVLNEKTSNSLFEIIVNKYRSNMNMFHSIYYYKYANDRSIQLKINGLLYKWDQNHYLKNVIKFQ